jgi:hypothetical protein
VEARHVKLNPFAARRADPFHDKLRLADQLIAGVTRLTRTSSAPNARNTVLRKPTIGELALDQETKGVLLHEVPPGAKTPTRKAVVQAYGIVRLSPLSVYWTLV